MPAAPKILWSGGRTVVVTAPHFITSRDNPQLRALRKLAGDNTGYRKSGQVWVEGEHLCSAAVLRGVRPAIAVLAQSLWLDGKSPWAGQAPVTLVLPDALFKSISALESSSTIGFVLDLPAPIALDATAASVVLDRVQDAGNVGSILRSAAAFGFSQVIALRETAALWSPKVLRAGMGAHFGLALFEAMDVQALDSLRVPLVVTSSHEGALIQHARLPFPCAWVLGHEGQGVSPTLLARAALQVRIGQPGGEESLNVVAAAAICLHASATTSTRG
jgi:TrmH family RNA methyltransferase